MPENDTSESKSHILLPFAYSDEDLPTQAAVGATTVTAKINSTNNANTNNKTVKNINSILIPPNTTTTAANNRANNKNTNNNIVNNSNKPLTPSSTTTTNNNTNNANTNNSLNNTNSNLMSSSINEESNEFEECDNAYAAQQNVKEKVPVLNLDQWKKGTTIVVGDWMLTGLREAKLSRIKRIKVRYFPGGKTEDLQYHLVPYLKKETDNVTIHIGTSGSPYHTEDFIYKELVNVKETINKPHTNSRNVILSPIVCTEKKKVNSILKKYINILKQEERNIIFQNNISALHLHMDGLHLNFNGKIISAGNLLSRIRTF